eukprot:TRINITY_DN38040_c0_g1_i1.p1 TRINITY_DN38040_c0_g1~~TRINITY_DN38040_c0_g1_i1.p1  ORF type:complete len:129 (+),score=14.22 TRINITY_DN38040_c0_g1_i1:200-586(+)
MASSSGCLLTKERKMEGLNFPVQLKIRKMQRTLAPCASPCGGQAAHPVDPTKYGSHCDCLSRRITRFNHMNLGIYLWVFEITNHWDFSTWPIHPMSCKTKAWITEWKRVQGNIKEEHLRDAVWKGLYL